MTDTTIGYGQQDFSACTSEFNSVAFQIRQMISRIETMRLVQVQAVHGNGDTGAPGTVDVLPLVNQVDGNGNATPQGTVYGLPWFRLQGGPAAVICDPKVDDIGYVTVSNRDISNVKSSKKASTPGSFRRFSLADGVYVGGCLNAGPTEYIAFLADGIKISSATRITLVVGSKTLVVDATGITIDGKVFEAHVHGGVTTGGGVTGIPV